MTYNQRKAARPLRCPAGCAADGQDADIYSDDYGPIARCCGCGQIFAIPSAAIPAR